MCRLCTVQTNARLTPKSVQSLTPSVPVYLFFRQEVDVWTLHCAHECVTDDRICPFADSDRFSPTGVELCMQASRYHRITAKSAELMRRICTIQSTFSLITVPRAEGGGGSIDHYSLAESKASVTKIFSCWHCPIQNKSKKKERKKIIKPFVCFELTT